MKKTVFYFIIIILLSFILLISKIVNLKSANTPTKIDYTKSNILMYFRNNLKKISTNQIKVKYYIYPTFTDTNLKYFSDYISIDETSKYFDKAFTDEWLDFDIVKSKYKSEINCIRSFNGVEEDDKFTMTQTFVDIDNIPRNFKTYNMEDYCQTYYEGLKNPKEVKDLVMQELDTVDTMFDKIVYFNYRMKNESTKETRIFLFKKIPMYDGTNCIMLDIRNVDFLDDPKYAFSLEEAGELIEGLNIVME